ncbi:MAG: hypothetical protein GC151_13725 [Betaproteobacteria bacterium]|nr:hypothetical protein [Betaproteobacteria bacterium]
MRLFIAVVVVMFAVGSVTSFATLIESARRNDKTSTEILSMAFAWLLATTLALWGVFLFFTPHATGG